MMRKSLQILFGLLLMLALAYIAFLDVSTKIKDDLLTKAKVVLSENNVRNVVANIQGEGSSMSRTLVLTGTAISEVERVRIVTLIETLEGVCNIDNQIKIYPVVPKVPIVPKAPSIPKLPTAIKAPVLKTSTEPVMAKSIPKESVEKKTAISTEVATKESTVTPLVENKTGTSSVSSLNMTTKIPTVPTVVIKDIVVPTPIQVIKAPKVIEVEKIKLEGVE